jgi:hypothetical protein
VTIVSPGIKHPSALGKHFSRAPKKTPAAFPVLTSAQRVKFVGETHFGGDAGRYVNLGRQAGGVLDERSD